MAPTPQQPNPRAAGPRRRRWLWWAAAVGFSCFSCWLLFPVVVKVRNGEAYGYSARNLKVIGYALRSYHEAYGHLPPATVKAADGRPLLSWRVAILPYLEQDNLYRQSRPDEPWDGPTNHKLLEQIPRDYQRPFAPIGDPTGIHYQVFVGPNTAFERDGLTWADFPDGPANTILVVEAADPVPWTKPADLDYHPDRPLPALGTGYTKPIEFLGRELRRVRGFNALFGDGTVRFISESVDAATLRALITRNGGEAVDPEKLD